jgi:hypothetical protein
MKRLLSDCFQNEARSKFERKSKECNVRIRGNGKGDERCVTRTSMYKSNYVVLNKFILLIRKQLALILSLDRRHTLKCGIIIRRDTGGVSRTVVFWAVAVCKIKKANLYAL